MNIGENLGVWGAEDTRENQDLQLRPCTQKFHVLGTANEGDGVSQAFETLGSQNLVRNWSSPGVSTAPQDGQPLLPAVEFSALKWRQKYTRILVFSDLLSLVLLSVVVLASGLATDTTHVVFAGVSVVVWGGCLALMRTRAQQFIGVGAKEYKRVIDSSAIAMGTMAMAALVLDLGGVREQILVIFPVGTFLLLAGRWLWRRWLWTKSETGYALSQVVVVGQSKDVGYVVRQLEKNAGPAYKICALVLDDDRETSRYEDSVPTLWGLDHLEHAVQMVGADSVIVAGALRGGTDALKDLSWRLEESRTNVIVVSSLTNVAGPRISVRPVEGLPLMHVEVPSFAGGHHMVKRVIDIVLSSVALLFLSPLFLVIALLVRKDGGPAVFSQERVGRDGQTFKMYKFRSMIVNAEAELEKLKEQNEGSGLLFKMKNDPRITKVGSFLRKYSLDELPQIYNALRGDMSLVGPRPPLPSEVACYEGHTGRRLFIKPGLTGLWQVNGRSDLDWEESVRLDLYYVENWSLTGDIMIMWRTFKAMIQPSGAY